MDPISDMLTRVNNAVRARKEVVEIPCSRIKKDIARVLKEEGYVSNFKVFEDGKSGLLKILLRYTKEKEPAISGIKRMSKPSCRIYWKSGNLHSDKNWFQTTVLSTCKGVMTGRQAAAQNLGGEVLLKIW